MRRFQFKLQQLLNLKEYREREWEIKLGEVTGRMEEIRQRIASCRERRTEGFSLRAASGNDLAQFAAAENYVRRMEQQSSKLEQELARLAKERETIQAGYIEASRERKVYEKLREKREAEFYREQAAAEVRIQDDLNSGAAARRIEKSGSVPRRAGGLEP